ncbi:Uncharacterized protein LOK49_LG08G00184 [Camellia lanceoleosa]|uniref:Uncharacterized protein n=1 Tax=Camellia lanceoleosa TaxID=1840588 RepID=A0ACC0GYE8_9ERIC|nr:Uncharacterized protein LOK49_LG08G00184 [Camellia lanceoleosa]
MFLPKPVSANNFQNHTFSPTKDKRSEFNQTKLKTNIGKGFSGPIISIIPPDARRNTKNSSFEAQQEPTSPKVSCIGQIKHKKVIKNEKHASPPKDFKPVEPKKKVSKIRSLFSSKTPTGRKSDDSDGKSELSDKAPSLSQTRRFSNGRDARSSFDWMAHVAPVDGDSDEESEGEEEEREIITPFSAPILVGGGGGGVVALEPRKEINLWKRRTTAQPRPLQVNILF